ncbi:MAG: hypothetical protein AB1918_14555 [Pseudomonadota bacterium]
MKDDAAATEDYDDACLRGLVADVRRDIDADQWTSAYVKLLRLSYCDRRASCSRDTECARVREVFGRNIERMLPDAKAG